MKYLLQIYDDGAMSSGSPHYDERTRREEAAYGSDGAWARCFAGGDGYEDTELWRGGEAGVDRYLVIDRWRSEAAYEAFLSAHADEYRRRSAAAEGLYVSEQA